ncbi:MAG TPA: Crp/Fnr family transcriptional regulator [Opitutaceae bacterium]|nr:Crp/Fnr family transcriptional regulator [Opitutaceae bacterium]
MPDRPADLRTAAPAHALRACELFAGLPPADVETIAAFAILKPLAKGALLFREGEASEGFYVVQRGAVSVHRVSPAGKEQVIHVFRPGESFAEATLATGTGYPADARAVEPSSVLLIPRTPMVELLGRRPDLALRMLGAMSQHLRVLVGLLDDLTLKDVETRLLNWLLKRCPPAATGEARVELRSTKRTLAAELGTTSETLSRTFARLRTAGLIRVERAAVLVRDSAALRARFARLLGE